MSEITLRGGDAIDGRRTARVRADVVIEGNRITGVLPPGSVHAGRVIAITVMAVATGFIDMHAHSDLAVLADPQHIAKVAQGVTLEVVSQDGLGYFPITDAVMDATGVKIAGWNGTPDLDYAWRSVADYLARVDQGSPVNVVTLMPHGTDDCDWHRIKARHIR